MVSFSRTGVSFQVTQAKFKNFLSHLTVLLEFWVEQELAWKEGEALGEQYNTTFMDAFVRLVMQKINIHTCI